MGEHKIGGEFDKADRLEFWLQHVKKFLSDNKLTMTLKPPPEKEVAAAFTKAKKKAQIFAVLDGSLLTMEVRIPGIKPMRIGAKDLDSLHDNGKQRDVMNKLADTTKLITRADVEKWHKTHFDKEELSFWKETLTEMTMSQAKIKAEVTALEAYKWGVDDRVRLVQLHAYTRPKSWEHYLKFCEDIEAKKDPAKIYDTYIKKGADFPVNLDPAMAASLAKQLAANEALNLKPAHDLIAKVIDAKFVKGMRDSVLPDLKKELTRLNGALPQSKKDFVAAGGAL